MPLRDRASDGRAGEYGNANMVTMEFYSFNPTSGSYPSSMSFVAIDFELQDGQKEINSMVVESGKYHIYVASDVSISAEGLQCETEDGETGLTHQYIE